MVAAVVGVVALSGLAGCAVGTGDDSGAGDPPSSSEESGSDPTAALLERCGSTLEGAAESTRVVATTFEADGAEVSAAVVGPARARTAAVLLPQTAGMCGWGHWAAAAAEEGITSVLVDPCGYGDTVCDEAADADVLAEVAPAIAHAREEVGARRVVLGGASMGGSLTVQALAAGAQVDDWFEVSGPATWDDARSTALAPDLPPGGLVMQGRSDGPAEYRAAQRLAEASGARFVGFGDGHGWELLARWDGRVLRGGELLLDHVAGDRGR